MWESATDKALILQEENTILKENAEHNDKVVDKVNWENMLLKKENKQQKDVINKIEDLVIIKKERCLNENDYVLNISDLDDILHLINEVSKWIKKC